MKLLTPKWLFVAILTGFALVATGCRQGPAVETKYYAREIAQMEKEAAKREAEKAEANRRYMPDRYPWRGTKEEEYLRCTPCRIKIQEKCYSKRIEYLTEAIHGKRKSKLRLRD